MKKNNLKKYSIKKHTIKQIGNYLKKYWLLILLTISLAGITVFTTLYIPILTGKGVDCILGKEAVHFAKITPLLYKIAEMVIITAICQWLMNTCSNYITYHVILDIRKKAFDQLEILPLKYLDAHGKGEIVSRIITDADQFADGLLMGFTQLFTGVLTIVGTLGFMLSVNPGITLVVVVITPLSLFAAGFIAKKAYSMFRLQSETRGELTSYIDEMVGNQKVVTAFSYEKEALKTFDAINERLETHSLKATFFSSITNPTTRFINALVYAGVGVTGAFLVIRGRISVGQLSCFLAYANQYTKPFNEISGVVAELQNALVCAERIFDLIDEEPQPKEAVGALQELKAKGDLNLKNVGFSYTENKAFIENLDLEVKQGQRVAIVGPTGCGKTTVINLLMRFYDVSSGCIKLDNIPIHEITRGALRKNFGMVLQDTWIKEGTVWENITLGKPEATKEEVIEAAKATHAHSFIKRLSKGYDTFLSEEGGNLSQGQKQLLCITRVMLCLPPMLILDEATSSIDTRTEIQIQHSFDKLMKGRTSFVVAHRLSTIREAHIILVMKDGKIIEKGSHEELLKQKGFYAELYHSQFA
ncbi:MAG: ABC transporter ATP-binding protein [Acetivibrio sp.]